ncbi:MAG: choice-of-anchor Q domain-containing protein [Actinomycetota bacterium]|nr:choice-of-anchor Q domain-containing protein [Actinomycetota bacterium]
MSRKQRKIVALGGGAAIVAAGPLVGTGDVQAAGFEVTNLNDDGAGSLRQAVADANALAGPDTITFQSGLTGTIVLTTGQLNITDSVTVTGPGAAVLSVSGNDASRVFYLYNPAVTPIDVTITDLTVTDGNAAAGLGGGIVVMDENLTLSHVVVKDSAASKGGGLSADGFNMALTISDSQITGNTSAANGGGMYVEDTGAPLLIERTVISGNSTAAKGGGIYFYDPDDDVTIIDSTISGNSAASDGGGIYLYSMDAGIFTIDRTTVSGNTAGGDGGGIYLYGPDLPTYITNSTISGNTADGLGGGVFLYDSYNGVTIAHSTIVGNSAYYDGGGLAVGNGTVAIDHVIIADNTVTGAPQQPVEVRITEAGDDLATNLATIDADFSLVEATDVPLDADNILGTDPTLGALANNGGPTQTHLPQAGSPAIDAGDPAIATPPATDQRGLTRIVNSIIDIGAVEVALPPVNNPPVALNDTATATAGGSVTITVLTNDSDPDSDALTITAVTQGAKGTVTINGITVVYQANANASGTDSFTYTISDGINSVTATVVVTITARATLPATGDDHTPTALLATGLLAAGAALTTTAKRRRPQHS